MLKIISLIFVLMLFITPVIAGNTLNLDFGTEEEQFLWVNQGDRILLEWGGFNHTLIFDSIEAKKIDIDIFLFLDGWKEPHSPQYLTLTDRNSARIDFDRNQIDDLNIESIVIDAIGKRSQIRFSFLGDADPSVIIDFQNDYIEDEKITPEKEFKYIYSILMILVVLIIIGLYVGKRNKSDIYH